MQRSVSLPVLVHCAHHGRPVRAIRNAAIAGDGGRLVSCSEADACRSAEAATSSTGEPSKVFPRGCAVYPSLAK